LFGRLQPDFVDPYTLGEIKELVVKEGVKLEWINTGSPVT